MDCPFLYERNGQFSHEKLYELHTGYGLSHFDHGTWSFFWYVFISCCCEDFSSVWSCSLVNSVKIEDNGDATDFENEDDFETLFNFNNTIYLPIQKVVAEPLDRQQGGTTRSNND